jgi:hypothetical protein
MVQPDEIGREWAMIHGTTPHAWLASCDGTRVYDTILGSYFETAGYQRHFGCVEQWRYTGMQTASWLPVAANTGHGTRLRPCRLLK